MIGAMRKVVLALGFVVVSAAGVIPAEAAGSGPVVFDVHVVRHGVFESCGTFAVNFVSDVDAHYEQWFSDSGQLLLERRHVQFNGSLTNSTTGASLPYEGDYIRTFDASSGIVTLIGERRKTQVSGGGVLAIAAGRLVIDTKTGAVISESGQTDASYNAAICSLLA